MKIVTIYLRSIGQKENKHLSLFDSNGNGDIDNLVTEVEPGSAIIWKLDGLSGIKSITKIFSKTGKRNIFKTDPEKQWLSKAFKLQLSKDAEGEEAYTIEYILSDNTKVIIDPVIRIPPPPPPPG
jgi:hypothetical protein